MTNLVWFRNDLRIKDNKALFYSCQQKNKKIISIFISIPKQWKKNNISLLQINFIYENLSKLQKSLYKLGIPLIHHQCDDFESSINYLKIFCKKEKIKEIFYNKQYELNEIKRDEKLKNLLNNEILINSFDDGVLFPPGSILNSKNKMYKIFTPFRNACIKKIIKENINSLPNIKNKKYNIINKNFISKKFNQIYKKTKNAGEKFALNKLKSFCQNKIHNYVSSKEIPSINGTSFLSKYLNIGVLSPRQCINELKIKNPKFIEKKNNAFIWLNALIWREFYRHLMFYHHSLCKNETIINWTNNIQWNENENFFTAWKEGLTGYPIVDAGMRQLKKTGWINNRLRMITSSFLVKDLLINWKKGEKYFMNKLLDCDFASNNGNWQWIASVGTDFLHCRIFNPTIQGKKFDPKGIFIRIWIPELKKVPNRYIHNPHLWAKKHNFILKYPSPIIDHIKNKKNTLDTFKKAKMYYKSKN